MAKKLVINDSTELITAMGKELKGYTISNKVDANKFVYPVTLTLDTKTKTYTAVDSSKTESKKSETKTSTKTTKTTKTESKKSKICKYVVIGFIAVAVVSIVVLSIVL